MTIGSGGFAVLSALILVLGLAGVASRRHPVNQVASLAVALMAPVIAAAGFAAQGPTTDSPFGDGVAAIAAVALAAVVLVTGAALLLLRRRAGEIDLDIEVPPSHRRAGD